MVPPRGSSPDKAHFPPPDTGVRLALLNGMHSNLSTDCPKPSKTYSIHPSRIKLGAHASHLELGAAKGAWTQKPRLGSGKLRRATACPRWRPWQFGSKETRDRYCDLVIETGRWTPRGYRTGSTIPTLEASVRST